MCVKEIVSVTYLIPGISPEFRVDGDCDELSIGYDIVSPQRSFQGIEVIGRLLHVQNVVWLLVFGKEVHIPDIESNVHIVLIYDCRKMFR